MNDMQTNEAGTRIETREIDRHRESDLIAELRSWPEGLLEPQRRDKVMAYLAARWEHMQGGRMTSMTAAKLWRAEQVTLVHPATITFLVERHGATCCGSVYAEVHCWTCDLLTETAGCNEHHGRRVVGRRDKPLKVQPLADDVTQRILSHDTDSNVLTWKSDADVRVCIADLIPATNKETTGSRRKRFRTALRALLAPHGWNERSPSRFVKTADGLTPETTVAVA